MNSPAFYVIANSVELIASNCRDVIPLRPAPCPMPFN